MKILFAATGEIAVPTLVRLNELGLVKAVLTTPDVPGKRGKALLPSPIKVKALELGLEVYQPESLRTREREYIRTLDVDTLVSFCYGKIFGRMFLALFKRKYNIHPSLLPKYRGASPLYAALRNGDSTSGITIQEIALEVDSGDIINSMEFNLEGSENNKSLEEKVSILASELAAETFSNIDAYTPRAQVGEPCYVGFIEKTDGEIDFTKDARSLHCQIRACYPWPKAYTTYKGATLFLTGVCGTCFDEEEACTERPGTVVSLEKKRGFKIATGKGYLYVTRLQAPAKKEMDAQSFFNGDRNIVSSVLGE